MLSGAFVLSVCLWAGYFVSGYSYLLTLWFVMGIGYSVAQTPTGRLIRRSANPEDRTALFAAQFTFSHACWLITYPLAGWFSSHFGAMLTFIPMATISVGAITLAYFLWPTNDVGSLAHVHDNLAPDNTHQHIKDNEGAHTHEYIIDANHTRWPK